MGETHMSTKTEAQIEREIRESRAQAAMALARGKGWRAFSLRKRIRGDQYAVVIKNEPPNFIFKDVTLDELEEWAGGLKTLYLCDTQAELDEAWKLAYISPSHRMEVKTPMRKILTETERRVRRRAENARYVATPAGRAALHRTQARYFKTEKGIAARRRFTDKQNAKVNARNRESSMALGMSRPWVWKTLGAAQ
jgi:hypothetical protein